MDALRAEARVGFAITAGSHRAHAKITNVETPEIPELLAAALRESAKEWVRRFWGAAFLLAIYGEHEAAYRAGEILDFEAERAGWAL